ncbi:MAG: hypothetical protein JKY65_13920 [Planctomycetes bacterium]|nr:hypothetical protein [Planctomycetota bacterium]
MIEEVSEVELEAYQVLVEAQGLSDEIPAPGRGTWRERADARVPEVVLEPERQVEGNAHTLSIGSEIFGWTDAGQPFHNERERPVEVGGYLRYRHRIGLSLRAGISRGLTNGIGAPDVRYFGGIGWSF